ncbi:hypothetical protein BXZ70DRAFT_1011687 [Cristinia sonorae]|uniref:Uncharacterized protein n=1 Tax=Cristinia sonorae TaxID=1940300 RepID=A0A8K0XL08_9AGAR|nr:hypothetical protein BXZ70DRAFT_1011687 [Cristinia sonorae]
MRYLTLAVALSSLFLQNVQPALVKRQEVIPIIPFETIVAPTPGTTVTVGQSFDINYPVPFFPQCPSSLYPISLYLLDHAPTASDVNPGLPNGPTIVNPLFQFGEAFLGWAFPDQSPPNIPGLPPLPSNLTLPDLGIQNGEIFFVVTQLFTTCPGHGAIIEVGVSSVAVEYTNA